VAALPDLVLFDCDGVLVDSERIAVQVDARVLADLGWQLSEAEIVHRFVGRSDDDFVADVEAHLGRALADGWDAAYQQWYVEAFEHDLVAVDGVVEALDALAAAGVPTCVASGGSHAKMRRTLGLTGLWGRFDGRIFSAEDVPRGKPEPDLFLHAAARMGAEPARCAVVEDSVYGVRAARAAGMRVLGYGGGVTPGDRLAGQGTGVFNDMRELPTLLGLPGAT
jgi:HAD superfamily hydrolase (TIGR01509 family)